MGVLSSVVDYPSLGGLASCILYAAVVLIYLFLSAVIWTPILIHLMPDGVRLWSIYCLLNPLLWVSIAFPLVSFRRWDPGKAQGPLRPSFFDESMPERVLRMRLPRVCFQLGAMRGMYHVHSCGEEGQQPMLRTFYRSP